MRIRVKHGIDVGLAGEPVQQIEDAAASGSVALLGSDYRGLRPSLAVSVGERVQLGQTLFTDRRYSDLRFTAPAEGRISAIHRGPRRRLVSVVIDVDEDASAPVPFEPIDGARLDDLTADHVRERLLESGLWTAFRARPFDGVPAPHAAPSAILVTSIDTNPLAADPAVVLDGRAQAFADGIEVLARLTGELLVCKRPELVLPALSQRARIIELVGPHPAGLPGTHVARLRPASQQHPVWHIGYQDVVAVGELFVSGRLTTERVVALGGPGAQRPRLLRTRIGASLDSLLDGETHAGSEAVAGSVFANRAIRPETAWLGRYDAQIGAFAAPATSRDGSVSLVRGMLPLEAFERAWPFESPVLPLLRALLVGDVETAQALGCLDLAEEDLGVCEYLCPARQDYGTALRRVLDELESGAPA